MRFRKTLTVLILALAFALAAWAQQKHVAPTLRSALAPARRGAVSAGPWPAGADLKVSATSAAGTGAGLAASPAKPFTQEQVSNMVRDGLGDETGAKAITQRGIDFAPTEDFIQSLKTAGASQAFIAAVRAAQPPEPASARKPINQVQVFALLTGQVPNHRIAMLVQERGIDFEPTDEYLQEVRLAGGEDELIGVLKGAKVTIPPAVKPPAQAQQAEVQQHVARGAELAKKGQYAEAEEELRGAADLQPENAEIHDLLGNILFHRGNKVGAQEEFREAVRLKPDFALAHRAIGVVATSLGDEQIAFQEYQKAYVLDPREPLIREAYAEGLARSWPSLVKSSEGPLPRSWSDTWRFYVYHCSPYDVIWCFGGTDPADACPGVLEVGNGRIKHSCRHSKYSFDAALSDVREAKIYDSRVVITFRNGTKTRTVEFVATDRLGHAACPPGTRAPDDALLDAILQATGK